MNSRKSREESQARLIRLEKERKALLKTYRGVVHEDASSESKYIRLKILENQIAHLREIMAQGK